MYNMHGTTGYKQHAQCLGMQAGHPQCIVPFEHTDKTAEMPVPQIACIQAQHNSSAKCLDGV